MCFSRFLPPEFQLDAISLVEVQSSFIEGQCSTVLQSYVWKIYLAMVTDTMIADAFVTCDIPRVIIRMMRLMCSVFGTYPE